MTETIKPRTRLDLLNQLLKNHKLHLPSFRTTIDRSGRNLAWLKKHVSHNVDMPDNIKHLLDLPLKTLLEEVEHH